MARWISSRLYTGTRDLRLAQYLLLGVGGMRALQALGIDPSVVHLNEGHAAFASLELARAELAAGASLDDALAAARARTVFTTHTPVPGGQRHLRARAGRRVAGHAGRRGRRRPRHDRAPRPHAPRRRRRAVRRHPVRPAHEPLGQRRQPPPRRGRARDVGRAVARPRRRRRADRLRHQRRAPPDLAGRSDARAARPPPRRGLDGPRRRPRHLGAGSTTSTTPSCGPRAASSAPRSSTWARERSMVDRLGRDEPRELRRGAGLRPRRADDRLRPAPGDLQAPARAAARAPRASSTCSRASARSRSCSPARRTRATTTASAACRRCSRPRASPRSGAASPTSTTTTSPSARAWSRGCDVWVNLPRPPLEASGTSGMKSAANGGPAAQRPRRLVGRGLRRRQRLGAVGRRRRRPRRAGRPRRRRAPAPAPRRGRAGLLRPRRARPAAAVARAACARRCAPTAPEFSATRMLRDYGERIYG